MLKLIFDKNILTIQRNKRRSMTCFLEKSYKTCSPCEDCILHYGLCGIHVEKVGINICAQLGLNFENFFVGRKENENN